MNPSLLFTMVRQTRIFSFSRTTVLGEGQTLNSESMKYCLGESVGHLNYSSVTSSSKKVWPAIHMHYKQNHLFEQSRPSNILCDGRAFFCVYIFSSGTVVFFSVHCRLLAFFKVSKSERNNGLYSARQTHGVWVSIYIFTNHSAWAEYDTRSIFKRSLTGLNSEFSFS